MVVQTRAADAQEVGLHRQWQLRLVAFDQSRRQQRPEQKEPTGSQQEIEWAAQEWVEEPGAVSGDRGPGYGSRQIPAERTQKGRGIGVRRE